MQMGSVEIPSWLEGLPMAPEFRPTDTEFADPIAYISKIEKEASAFGICKIIPPLPRPSKKYAFHNLNRSLAKCPELGPDVDVLKIGCAGNGDGGEVKGVFTTRQQELGQSVKKAKGIGSGGGPQPGVHKQVWQSGEVYTLEQFESKAKGFARGVLGKVREVSPLVIEALFWNAATEEPIYVEYANDVPGSAFGEPECPSRFFHRRRRRKVSYRRSEDYRDGKKNEMDSRVGNCNDIETKNGISQQIKIADISSSVPTDVTSQPSTNKSSSISNEMEGTAGWKLSNSPWNLQVIARSPGSLTRFMPDDIPGVTSPMVYIGMLFSWFAWHVEDHELHSMNFLHIGSQKTWYAVPADYAFSFEEVIRRKAYGVNVDRLAALKLLGEKTTLLSPELLVASGIPCCRLVQNPGEFVVTFPRAYHVGFSHGFNCGEAANFGTPQWLNVAKEAAVRRAVMSYLPMLSHQQLLYLLTMSFVLRVPRSLLPGARSSRLRDRQKEERELLVKKAFIDDILNENHLLSVLLKRESKHNAVIWHPDLLPSPYRASQLPSTAASAASASGENDSGSHFEKENSEYDLSVASSLYLDTLYEDDDDLLCDFQTDSGTLACVACGILGYPFMCVVQPSDRASKELMPTDSILVHEVPRRPVNTPAQQFSGIIKDSVAADTCSCSALSPLTKDLTGPLVINSANRWNTSDRYLRPQIFCLEHALQIEELLQSRGGANVLVICHSDYQKMKAHAVAVAEEIDRPFNYDEISLASASQEELKLIDLAIEDERCNNCVESWTSKLGINLRYCVKICKESPSKQVNYALALAGLFADKSPSLGFSPIKWISKRPRSKLKLNFPALHNLSANTNGKKDDMFERSLEVIFNRRKDKLIQYSRRKRKMKSCGLAVAKGYPASMGKDMLKQDSSAIYTNPSNLAHQESRMLRIKSDPVVVAQSMATNESLQLQGECHIAENIDARSEESNPTNLNNNEGHLNTVADENVPLNGVSHNDPRSLRFPAAVDDSNERMDNKASTSCIEVYNSVTWNNKLQPETKTVHSSYSGEPTSAVNIVQNFPNTEEPTSVFNTLQNFSNPVPLKERSEAHTMCSAETDETALSNRSQQIYNTKNESNTEKPVSNCAFASNSSAQNCGVRSEARDGVRMCDTMGFDGGSKDKSHTVNEYNEETFPVTNVTQRNEIAHHTASSEVTSKAQGTEELRGVVGMTLVNGVQQKIQVVSERNEENVSSHVKLTNQPSSASTEECLDFERENHVVEDSHNNSESRDIKEPESIESTRLGSRSNEASKRKRKKGEQILESKIDCNGFIRSPCEGLRPRGARKDYTGQDNVHKINDDNAASKKARKSSAASGDNIEKRENTERLYRCDLEGCRMIFKTKSELQSHKNNRCPLKGCGKRFSSHKSAVLHQRVHDDDRPLKCPWEGCSMSFKWAWARTEHIRVHTGERPYQCKVEGCGRSFRFVSDYSRHRRKTGHYVNPSAG